MADVQNDVAIRIAGTSDTDIMNDDLLVWSQLSDVKNASHATNGEISICGTSHLQMFPRVRKINNSVHIDFLLQFKLHV